MSWAATSIRSKLVYSILLVAGISLVLGLSINTYQDVQTYRADLEYQTEILTQIVGDYCQAPLDFNSPEGAEAVLQKLHANDQVVGARVTTSDSTFFASYGDKDVLELIEKKEQSFYKEHLYFLSKPILLHGKTYGYIQMAFSTAIIKEKVFTQILNMMVILVVILVFAFLAALRVQQNIQGPVLNLVHIADRISREEDYSLRIQRLADDEIGSLYDSFNNMLSVIQNRDRHLKIREEDFRNIFNSQHDAIFIHDTKGNVLDVNDTMLNMYLVTREDALQMNIIKDLSAPGNDLRILESNWQDVLNGIRHEFEWKARKPQDGSFFDAQVNLQKVKHREGEAILAIVRDITQRKLMEKGLKESEAKFRNLIEHLNDAVYVSSDDKLLLTNNKFREMLNLESELETEDPFKLEEYLSEESLLTFNTHISNLKANKLQEVQFEISIQPGVGRERQLEATFSFIPIQNIKALQGILRDVTERKNLEEQFRQVQKMEAVGRLAGGVAHDFNNILTVINGYCDMLIRKKDLDPKILKPLNQIYQSGQRATRLTRQLLAFSRKQVLQPKTIDVNHEINELYSMLVRLIGEDIQIKTIFAPDIFPINIDLGQLEQVLLNITVNARDAMPGGGTLTIETKNVSYGENSMETPFQAKTGTYVMIAISDTGLGMDPQTKSRIFEPFFSTKDLGKGTGLGLSMVYGIIKQHEGLIWVDSELGLGSTFKCFFPTVSTKVLQKTEEETSPRNLNGTETILIVEDNPDLRGFVESVFAELDYKLYLASNGVHALEVCKEIKHLDFLLTDVVMPEKSGPELVEEVRPQFPGLKILFMSGYTGNELIQDKLLEEGVDFIQKPFAPNDLLTRIRHLLD